jgi:hypothetical protein
MGPAHPFAACEALAATLGMSSVGISLRAQPMHASDRLGEEVEGRQFVLGEGPLVDAFLRRCPIEVADTAAGPNHAWMELDLAGAGVAAVFAFPMVVGAACLGAVTLYRGRCGALSDGQRALGAVAADAAALETATHLLAARQVRRSVAALRRVDALHRAVGVVMGQLGVDEDVATSRIRAYAFVTDRPVADVVDELCAGGGLRLDDAAPQSR